jgi:hypothetical protein
MRDNKKIETKYSVEEGRRIGQGKIIMLVAGKCRCSLDVIFVAMMGTNTRSALSST